MRSTVVTEHWRAVSAELHTEDFFGLLGQAPFAFLYGDGPAGRWLIHGEDPLLVLDSPDPAGIAFERRGDLPPIRPDFIGFIGYEFGQRLEPLLPKPAPRALPLPDFHFALHRKLRLFDRATGR